MAEQAEEADGFPNLLSQSSRCVTAESVPELQKRDKPTLSDLISPYLLAKIIFQKNSSAELYHKRLQHDYSTATFLLQVVTAKAEAPARARKAEEVLLPPARNFAAENCLETKTEEKTEVL